MMRPSKYPSDGGGNADHRCPHHRNAGAADEDDAEEVDPAVTAALSAALFADLQTAAAAAAANKNGADDDDDAADATALMDAARRAAFERAAKAKECKQCGSPAKYTCPRCGTRTCSLPCVREHKAKAPCTGVVDVAGMVPLSQFDDRQLRRDFSFIQDVARVVDNAHRGLDSVWRFSFRALPPPLHALREAAKKRGVLCQITSEGMSKRDRNTSRYDRRRDAIIWHVEFDVRHNVSSKHFKVESRWGNERFLLGDVFRHAWATNPPLLCYHIHRGYNRASNWVAGGQSATPTAGSGAAAAASGPGDAPSGSRAVEMPASTTATGVVLSDSDDDETQRRPNDVVSSGGSNAVVGGAGGENGAKAMPRAIQPTTPRSMTAKSNVERYVGEYPDMDTQLLFLLKADRIGATDAYFRLNPGATIHDNLRHVFFINEFPTVIVCPAHMAAAFPIVTDDQRVAIRESFRKKDAPRGPPPPRFQQSHGANGAAFVSSAAHFGAPAGSDGMPPPAPFGNYPNQPPSAADATNAAGGAGLLPRPPSDGGEEGGPPPPPRADFSQLSDDQRERLARVPCRAFRRYGRCDRGEACPFWHCAASDIPACRSMVTMGQCPLGPRCSFSHDEAVVRRTRDEPDFRRIARGGGGMSDDRPDAPRSRGRGGGRGGSGRGGWNPPTAVSPWAAAPPGPPSHQQHQQAYAPSPSAFPPGYQQAYNHPPSYQLPQQYPPPPGPYA